MAGSLVDSNATAQNSPQSNLPTVPCQGSSINLCPHGYVCVSAANRGAAEIVLERRRAGECYKSSHIIGVSKTLHRPRIHFAVTKRGALREASGGLGEADGVVRDSVTASDDAVPAVAKLDPDLLKALWQAAADAADENLTFYVNSDWRCADCQNQLLRKAVATYARMRVTRGRATAIEAGG